MPTATQPASGQARWPHRLPRTRLPWRGLPFGGQTGLGAVVGTTWAFGAGAGGGGNPHSVAGPGFSGSQAEAPGYVCSRHLLLPCRGSLPPSLCLSVCLSLCPRASASPQTPPSSQPLQPPQPCLFPPGHRAPLGSWSHPSRPSRASAMRAGVLCSREGKGSGSFAPQPVSCAALPGACHPPSGLPRSGNEADRPGPPRGLGFEAAQLLSLPQAEPRPQAPHCSSLTWPARLLPFRPRQAAGKRPPL